MISDNDIHDINQIIFTYKIVPQNLKIDKGMINFPEYNQAVNEIDNENKKLFKILGYNLPSTMDITK
jgi:hypothetical protein